VQSARCTWLGCRRHHAQPGAAEPGSHERAGDREPAPFASDRSIANLCKVSHLFVGRVRAMLEPPVTSGRATIRNTDVTDEGRPGPKPAAVGDRAGRRGGRGGNEARISPQQPSPGHGSKLLSSELCRIRPESVAYILVDALCWPSSQLTHNFWTSYERAPRVSDRVLPGQHHCVDIVGQPSFTNIFPKFSPLNSLRKAAGALSMPWSMVSLHVTLPSWIHAVISFWNSGMKSR
jgi:hypothetical protein